MIDREDIAAHPSHPFTYLSHELDVKDQRELKPICNKKRPREALIE